MKKRMVYIKKGIGIFLILLGIFIIISNIKITGLVIGVSMPYYISLIGILFLFVGAFISLEDIFSGFKERSEEKRKNIFRHRLNMGRVLEPIVYTFNENNYDRRFLREELKKVRTYSHKSKEKQFKRGNITKGAFSSRLAFLPSRYKFMPGMKPETYAHELIHNLHDIGIVDNDYVMANAIGKYIEMTKRYEKKETEYTKSQRDQVLNGELDITNRENLRTLTKREKRKGGKLEYTEKPGFRRTGNSLGYEAAHIEALSKKTGSGLYFIKLVSDGYSPEKARDTVLGDYKPLRQFQEKYGKMWKRLLEI